MSSDSTGANTMNHRYRKKPTVVEAFQMTKERRMDNSEWPWWLHEAWSKPESDPGSLCRRSNAAELPDILVVRTLEGTMMVDWGDWIIRGTAGELYPCKPQIFDAIYDPAE
jgi:hypothetical protein